MCLLGKKIFKEALNAYRSSLPIRERLTKAEPANGTWQFALSNSYEDIGNLLMSQGNLDDALKNYLQSLSIRVSLANTDRNNTGWQRAIAGSHIKMGAVFQQQGDLHTPLDSYRNGLAIIERLAETAPRNADWQRDLSVADKNSSLTCLRRRAIFKALLKPTATALTL